MDIVLHPMFVAAFSATFSGVIMFAVGQASGRVEGRMLGILEERAETMDSKYNAFCLNVASARVHALNGEIW